MEAGRELDALIAEKVMGLPRAELGGECPDCGSDTRMGINRAWCYSCHEWKYSPYKAYSTDIADAWEVVEHITSPVADWEFDLSISTVNTFPCRVTLFRLMDIGGDREKRAFARTAPLAICLAALKAVGVEVPEEAAKTP